MSGEAKMAEHPALPTTPPADAQQAATYAVAAVARRGRHGQHCPVWTHRAPIDACNCWILRNAHTYATVALAAAIAHDLAAT